MLAYRGSSRDDLNKSAVPCAVGPARHERCQKMATKLYVGNLPFDSRDNDLQELFTQHGEVVSAKVIVDRETDRSRGFGFVEMDRQDSAEAAISALDGRDFQGRDLKVNIARPRGEGGGGRKQW